MKILIVGQNSFLGNNIDNYLKKIFQVKKISFKKIKNEMLNYDCVINCSINSKYIKNKYTSSSDTDYELIKKIHKKCLYVMFSTRKVYKKNKKNYFTEQSAKKGETNYSINKIITENKILNYHKKTLILRASNIVGNRKFCKKDTISILKKNLLSKNSITIPRKICYKDYIPVKFVVKYIYLLIKSQATGCYNLCFGHSISLQQLSHFIIKWFGKGNIVFDNKRITDSFYCCNSKLVKKTKLLFNKEDLFKELINIGREMKKNE